MSRPRRAATKTISYAEMLNPQPHPDEEPIYADPENDEEEGSSPNEGDEGEVTEAEEEHDKKLEVKKKAVTQQKKQAGTGKSAPASRSDQGEGSGVSDAAIEATQAASQAAEEDEGSQQEDQGEEGGGEDVEEEEVKPKVGTKRKSSGPAPAPAAKKSKKINGTGKKAPTQNSGDAEEEDQEEEYEEQDTKPNIAKSFKANKPPKSSGASSGTKSNGNGNGSSNGGGNKFVPSPGIRKALLHEMMKQVSATKMDWAAVAEATGDDPKKVAKYYSQTFRKHLELATVSSSFGGGGGKA